MSLISRKECPNSINKKDKYDKIYSINIEKSNKYIKNFIQKNKENILNRTDNNSLNYINSHKFNDVSKEKKDNRNLKIYEKCNNILTTKKKKKIYIQTNFNNKLDFPQNNYYLTENDLNKIQFHEPNHHFFCSYLRSFFPRNYYNQSLIVHVDIPKDNSLLND